MEERTVTVTTPARLHMGFMDMHGGFGRNFGSLGLALAGVATTLTVTLSERPHSQGPDSARALGYAETVIRQLDLPGSVSIDVAEAIPEHTGLGSGTQLGLAVGAAVTRLFDLQLKIPRLAELTGRGLRSGLGIGIFEHGGFIVDGGRGERTAVPPVICRIAFPEPWRILLIFDRDRQGLHGQCEREAFEQLPGMTEEGAGRLCRCVMMQMLPALAERDFGRFADAVTYVQTAVGDLFAPMQNGRYTSARVAALLGWLRAAGRRGLGQTSWGPTGFA
ncbi:MAG: beta-ribofuranosylaminobenzene 5'-phosphate synthase family protein, partial [Chromatiales bacterium]